MFPSCSHIKETSLPSQLVQDNFALMESLGEKIKRYREANKITQRRMAIELDVTITTVQNWESGKHIPKLTLNQTKALCNLLNVTLDDLVDESN